LALPVSWTLLPNTWYRCLAGFHASARTIAVGTGHIVNDEAPVDGEAVYSRRRQTAELETGEDPAGAAGGVLSSLSTDQIAVPGLPLTFPTLTVAPG